MAAKKEKITANKEMMQEDAVCDCGDCGMYGYCNCAHHYVRPGLIAVFGLVFLLNAFGVLSTVALSYTWPSLVIAYGLAKMFENRCNCCGCC